MKIQKYNPGDVVETDIKAKQDIVYIDERATELRYNAMRQLIYPIFEIDTAITRSIVADYEDFASQFSELYKKDLTVKNTYLRIQTSFPGLFEEEEIERMMKHPNITELVTLSYRFLRTITNKGIIEKSIIDETILQDTIEVVNPQTESSQEQKSNEIIHMDNLKTRVMDMVRESGLEESDGEIVALLLSTFCEPNSFYNKEITEERRAQAIKNAEPVVKKLEKGEIIVRGNSTLNSEDIDRLEILKETTSATNITMIISSLFYLIILFLFAILIFNQNIIRFNIGNRNIYLLLGLYTFYLVAALTAKQAIGDSAENIPFAVFLPTALIGMLTAILINSRVSVFFSLLMALTIFIINDAGITSFLFAFFTGITGMMVVNEAIKRIDLIKATMYSAVISGVLIIVFTFLERGSVSQTGTLIGWGALNGFLCGFAHLGILPLLEHFLNAPTRFRLIELSDTNTPILKKMLTMAPGTYSHSHNVANLAESACREIGANALLARVGAYYHDIGKIDQAEYFIENQKADNKHNELKPSLSVAVIKSHVKIGIEKAKELKLPKAVIDIIAQHHGSGLITYFYSEALKDKKNNQVLPEDFSYTESPPKTKEGAVVMLADTIDAATRTLKKPSIAKLEKAVWDLIMQRFKEKQLNESDLTFKDLEIIKKTFVQILAGYFHSRIEYPRTNGEKH